MVAIAMTLRSSTVQSPCHLLRRAPWHRQAFRARTCVSRQAAGAQPPEDQNCAQTCRPKPTANGK